MKHEMKFTVSAPHFEINPLLLPPAWQGDCWGFRLFHNPHYLNSVWLGTVTNFLTLPQRLLSEIIRPLLRGKIIAALVGVLTFLMMPPVLLLAGLLGHVVMLHLPLELLAESRVLDEDEAHLAAKRPGAQAVHCKVDVREVRR